MKALDISFEAEISYFFGIKDPQPIVDIYFTIFSRPKEEMLSILHKAYELIQSLVPWTFDTLKAAELEQEIIEAYEEMKPFEKIADLYKRIYATIFNQPVDSFSKIAYLRTFLFTYQQKAESIGPLSPEEKSFLISIARMSERHLKEFELKASGY